MLGILVTSYLPYYYLYQDLLVSNLDKSKFKVIFATTHENDDFVKTISDNIKTPLYQLDQNPGKHDGTYYLVTSAMSEFDECDYILHYHADNWFRDGVEMIEKTYDKIKKEGYKIASVPRQWLFDDNLKHNDKTIPFHFDFCMMESDLFRNIFKVELLDKWKNLSIINGHPSQQFEPCLYAGLVENGVDIDNDIYYTDSIKRLKERFGDEVVYYNFFFEESGFFHYDQNAFDKKVYKD
tara:strand:+ start:414 stop:1127 length:714 start_codon:yes stop_codon:yes gene_type:complete